MRSASYEEMKVRGALVINPPQAWARLAIILGVTIPFIVAFQLIIEKTGYLGAVLIMIPVMLAGWYFGVIAGLAASLLGIVLVAALFVIFEGSGWFTGIGAGWPGELMVIAAGYLAGSLHKAFVERTYMVNELRSRERYLTLINMATKDILAPKDSGTLYYRLATRLVNLFVADYGYFVHWDAVQEQATLLATTIPLTRTFSGIVLDPDESALTMSVMQSGDPLAIEDVSDSHYVVNPVLFKEYSLPVRSALCIPLIAKDYKSGAVILAFNTPHHFTSEEIEYARLAGSQLALALCAIEQGLKIQDQLKEANTLASIEHILSEVERVGINTVLQFIVDSARGLIPEARHVILHLVDTEKQMLVPRAVAGFTTEPEASLNMHPGEGVAGQVLTKGEVIIVSDTQADTRFLNQGKPVNFRSLVVAPIQTNQHYIGTISIHSDRPNAFTPGDSRLLITLGVQAAVAIENASLLETTRQDLKEINTLYHISQGLVASLDPDQLMGDVVEFLYKNFEYYHVQIFIVDPKSGNLVARQGSGKIGAQLKKQGYYLPAGAGIVGNTAETGKPFVTNNVDDIVFFIRSPILPDTQSELAVPIKVENRVLGVLDIQQIPPGRLTTRDMQLMAAIADQLAVALQKANLYTELQTSLSQEKSTRSQLIQSERLAVVGRLLASVSHELNNPLQAIQNALFLLKKEEKLSVQGSKDLEIVMSEAERMTALIERLRTTYRPTRAEDFQDVQLNDIVEDIRALTATHMRHKEIIFEYYPDPELPVISGIPDRIRQVTLNLFINAIEAMQAGGRLTVSTERLPKQKKILLTITDTGPGINPEILPHIFEPFITNKETGTGLGLTITYDIIRQHNGDILAENNPAGGATFKVWFPTQRKG